MMNPLCDFSHLKFIQKDFWESQSDRKRDRKQNNNKKDVAKLILPPLMCYSWKKNKQKMDDSHLILILQVGLLGFLFWLRCQKSFADDLPHLLFFHAQTKKKILRRRIFSMMEQHEQ